MAEDCDILPVEKTAGNSIVVSAAGEKSVLDEDSMLALGDSIVTGKSAWVELRLCDGSAIKVGEKTKFKFESSAKEAEGFAGWAFGLLKGSLLAVVQGEANSDKVKLRVRTPTAALGVRGTEFMVDSDDAAGTSLHTIEGEVLLGTAEDFDQLPELKGPALAEKFEAVPKEQMSRIALGEMRPLKAMAFKLAELRQVRGSFFERKLAVIQRPEAMKKMIAARQRRMQRQQMNAKGENKQKETDFSATGDSMPGMAGKPAQERKEQREERKQEREEKREERKDLREERKEKREEKRGDSMGAKDKPLTADNGDGKTVDLTSRFENLIKNKSPRQTQNFQGKAEERTAPGSTQGNNRKKWKGNGQGGGQGQGQGQGQRSNGQGGGGGNRRKGN